MCINYQNTYKLTLVRLTVNCEFIQFYKETLLIPEEEGQATLVELWSQKYSASSHSLLATVLHLQSKVKLIRRSIHMKIHLNQISCLFKIFDSFNCIRPIHCDKKVQTIIARTSHCNWVLLEIILCWLIKLILL